MSPMLTFFLTVVRLGIEVRGPIAMVYVNGAKQLPLIVNDLKQPASTGGIALWIGQGTIAHFVNLTGQTVRPILGTRM